MSKTTTYRHEPSDLNKKQLADIVSLLQKYKTICITRVENISSKTIQHIRHDLHDEVQIKMAKNSLMRLAIKELAKNNNSFNKLLEYVMGSCAFLVTNSNPFRIANYLEKNKIPTQAKEGQIATKDIIISARETGFAPGPVIGELQSIGLKTRIEAGTIKIIEDSTVCKTGEKISKTLANVLGKLGIEPFDAGLSIDAVFTDNTILKRSELIIDIDEILTNFVIAYKKAYVLSLDVAMPIKENLHELIGRTQRQALSIAIETNFITLETAGSILAKTQLEAMTLAKLLKSKA